MLNPTLVNLSDFGLEGGLRKTLVVLGAGASRGASFVKDMIGPVPPLDLDFFQQVARLPQTNESRRLLAFLREEYGHEIGISMEQFFSEADYTDQFHRELSIDPGPRVKKYRRALEDFYIVLPRLLEATTRQHCDYHAALCKQLHALDCVLTFNYDSLVDTALKLNSGNKWDPDKAGYGFSISAGGERWKVHTRGRPVDKPIRLLKMHGSHNWSRISENEVALCDPDRLADNLNKVIIPPTWFKDLATHPFGTIWREARIEIRRARIIVVIGYSVPNTDLFSKSLFKVEAGSKIKREKLDLLVLVNPDSHARRIFLELVSGGIESTTTILEYNTFEELARVIQHYAI